MKTPDSFSLGALAGMLLVLSGCHHRTAHTNVHPAAAGMIVAQARLLLPAVKGNPGAAYFTLGNQNNVPTTLVRVDIVGVKQTEMHETSGGTMARLAKIGIDPGQRLIFAPAGKHVMAFGIASSLTPGGSSAISFHFQDGKSISAPLRIEAPGDGMGNGMAGMNMGRKP